MISTEHIYSSEVEVPLNPFPGLRPFEFNESNLYFGRDGQSERMLSKLAARRFVAVVGTSGSGKSSLVRAGLLPALYGGFMSSVGSDWRVAVMRPGNDPIGNLARALNTEHVFGSDIPENAELQTVITEATLRRGSLGLVEAVRQTRMPERESLLVLVDQFEELFRFAREAEGEQYQNEAAAFVKLLLGAIGQREVPVYVVLTLRSDYLGDCALFWGLPEAVNESQFLIPRLTREQRREAIAGPIAVCGGEITTRLVNRLLNDVGDNQDQLPLLQHALMRAWDNWRVDHAPGEPLDLRHYEAIGGMGEALSRHADEAFEGLADERSRQIAERMFKGLTELGADNREIRRPLELREICALTEATEEEVVAVIEPFRREGRSFLMPPAGVPLTRSTGVDISHESLIRCWQRLHEWVEEEARSASIYRRLAETAVLYRNGEAGLWRDPDLQLALNWRKAAQPNAAWARRYHPEFDAAMRFLEQGRRARDHEAYEKERARRRELRRTRFAVLLLSLLLLLSLALAAYARAKQQEALEKTEQLERKSRLLDEQRAVAEGNFREALHQRRIAEGEKTRAESERVKAEENFHEAERAREETLAQKQRAEEEARRAHDNELRAESARAEAERQRSMAEQQTRLAREAERLAAAQAERANNLLYAADLNLAQQAYRSGRVERAQELLATFLPQAQDSTFSGLRGYEWFYLWQMYHRGGDTLESHKDTVTAVAFSPDSKHIATASVDGDVKLWDAATRREVASPNWGASPVSTITSLSFSPDGRALAITASDRTVRLWDTTAPQKEPRLLRGASGPLYAVAFAPDGRTLAAGGEDQTVLVWALDAAGGGPRALAGHQGSVRALAYSPDGRTLASAGNDNTVRLWELAAPAPAPRTLAGHTQPVVALSFSADGATLASGSDDGSVGLWSVRAANKPPVMLKGHDGQPVTSLSFSPDGKTLASGGEDRTVRLWDTTRPADDGVVIGRHREIVSSVSFSPDGRLLATGGYDRRVRLWDVTAEHGLTTLKGIGSSVSAVAYSPDGRRLATANVEGEVKIWEAGTRRELSAFKAHADSVWSLAYSPDGRRLATAGRDATVKLWNLDAPQSDPVILRGGHRQAVYTVAFSADGHRVASGSDDRTIKVWDAGAPQAEPLTLEGHEGTVMSVTFSPDGRTLASAGLDGTLRLWDLNSPRPQPLTLTKGAEPVWAAAFSRDGRRLAAGGNDRQVQVWDTALRTLLGVLKGHEDAVRAVAFSPDGRTLATGSLDKTVRLWSATSFQELATLEGHHAAVSSVAFAPDGRTLASGSFDWYVKLWYAATDEEVSARSR